MPAPASAACVQSVETKLVQHLEAQGLGLPLKAAPSVRDVLASILINQGGKVLGAGTMGSILDGLADRVQAMVADLGRAGRASNGAGGVGLVEERENAELRARVSLLEALLLAHNIEFR